MTERMKERMAEGLARQEQAAIERPPAETLAGYLERQKPAILAALPKNVDVDRFTRIVLTTVRTNPRLLECDPMSLLAATMQAAQLGLEPGSGLGEAYIIPYQREATFQMGYKGAVKLARNSGDISGIWAEAVYLGDRLEVVQGSNPSITHLPDLTNPDRGTWEQVVSVYAVARLASGISQFVVMGRAEIERHRDRYAKAARTKDSPWSDPLGAVEMAKKTAVIRLCKMLPLSAEAARAFNLDGAVRRELSADMTLVPDKDSAPIPAEALGLGDADPDAGPGVDADADPDAV